MQHDVRERNDTTAEPTIGQLVSDLSTEVSQLVHDEMRLARVEMTEKAKGLGVGAGMFGAAGVLALYGGAALVATAVLALALVVDAWLAALIVTVALFGAAGVVALRGRRRVQEATPPVPTRTVENVQRDVAAVREAREHSHQH
jgi:uncharacterized membrane protein YqjE